MFTDLLQIEMGLSCSQHKIPSTQSLKTNNNDPQKQSDAPITLFVDESEVQFEIQVGEQQEIGTEVQVLMNLSILVKEEIASKIKRPFVDIAILLDVSNTMEGPKLENSKKAILSLLKVLEKMDRISIILFRGKAKIYLQWTPNIPENQDLLIKSILAIQTPKQEHQNVRNIEEAIELSFDLLDQSVNSQALFLLITDGAEYMNIDADKLSGLVLRCNSPKKYGFYGFTFDVLFKRDDEITKFVEFANGFNEPVTDIDNFELFFIFKVQQILSLYANEVKIVLQSLPSTKLMLDFHPKHKQLRFNDQKYEIRLKEIIIGINYNIPFKLILQSKEFLNQLNNNSLQFIQASLFGEILFRTQQLEQQVQVSNLTIHNTNNIVQRNTLKQEILFYTTEAYQLFQDQKFNQCLQQLSRMMELIKSKSNMQDTQMVFLYNRFDQIGSLIKQIQASKDQDENYSKIVIANSNFIIFQNLLNLQQDLTNQESLSLKQSQLINEFKVSIRKEINEKYQFYQGKLQSEHAEDLNDDEPENFLFKPSNF